MLPSTNIMLVSLMLGLAVAAAAADVLAGAAPDHDHDASNMPADLHTCFGLIVNLYGHGDVAVLAPLAVSCKTTNRIAGDRLRLLRPFFDPRLTGDEFVQLAADVLPRSLRDDLERIMCDDANAVFLVRRLIDSITALNVMGENPNPNPLLIDPVLALFDFLIRDCGFCNVAEFAVGYITNMVASPELGAHTDNPVFDSLCAILKIASPRCRPLSLEAVPQAVLDLMVVHSPESAEHDAVRRLLPAPVSGLFPNQGYVGLFGAQHIGAVIRTPGVLRALFLDGVLFSIGLIDLSRLTVDELRGALPYMVCNTDFFQLAFQNLVECVRFDLVDVIVTSRFFTFQLQCDDTPFLRDVRAQVRAGDRHGLELLARTESLGDMTSWFAACRINDLEPDDRIEFGRNDLIEFGFDDLLEFDCDESD